MLDRVKDSVGFVAPMASLALSGLLVSNLNTIGHSQMCQSIQYRALMRQIFELIINLPRLQPIHEDRLEAEDLSLSQTLAMVVALPLTLRRQR